jgi:hypothetical protein
MKNKLRLKSVKFSAILSFAFLLLFSITGQSQISIANSTPVTENFTIGSTATASLPANWRMSSAGTGSSTLAYTAGTNVTATSQAANSGNPTAGGRYNWGDGTTTTDRAIGFMTSGGYASPNAIQAFYRNTSGSQISDVTISFDFERYRVNTATASVAFFTSTNGTTWTARTTGDIATSVFATGASAYTFTGGTVASRSVTLTGVNIPNNGDLYVMWVVTNTGGSNSQGLGLDNVSLTATIVSLTPPTITLTNETKTYGEGNFSMTAVSNSGGTITYGSSNTGVATINTNSGMVTITGAGTTTITASQVANGTFSAGSTTATITVGKAAGLTVTANSVSKTFGTTLNNGSSTAISAGGLQYSDTLGTNPSATITYGLGGGATDSATLATVSPAVYAGTAVPSALVAGSGALYNANNYEAPTYVAGNITVSKANQSIAFAATDSRVYGDASYAPGATSATSGINPITYSSNTATVADIVSGNIQINGIGSAIITASQNGDDNYNATSTTQTLTVAAKALTISGLSANNKPFDGNDSATLSGTASLVGIVGTDDVSLTGTAVGTFVTSAVGTNITVNVSGLTLTGTNAGNYTLTPLTLSADIIANTPTLFTNGTLTALTTVYGSASSSISFGVSGQSLTEGILVTAPAGFEVSLSSASGYGSTVTVGAAGNVSNTLVYIRLVATNIVGTYSGDITISSAGATSVSLATVSSSVTPKELTITGLSGVDKTFDGTTTATVSGTASLVGVIGGDDVTLNSTSVTYNFADSNADIAKPITVLGYTLNGTSATNYTVAQPTGLTATIFKAASTISVTGAASFTYNAAAQGPNTSSVTGSTGAVTYSYIGVTPTVYGPSATQPTNAGDYTVAATVATDTNYLAATSADFSFSIAKADQTITLAAIDTRTTASAPYTLALNASSGLPITYQSSNGSVAGIIGNTVTIAGVGTTTITANQAGDANYNAAPEATQTLTVTLPACATTSGTTSWNFATALPSTTQANLTVSAITRANDVLPGTAAALITTTSASSGYSGSSGTNNAGVAAVAGALNTATSSYFAFTVTPAPGYNFTLNGISFGSRVTSSGPLAYSLRSSADNYATTIATGTLINDSVWRLLSNTGLTASGLGNATPVTFRLYGHGSIGNPGTAANWRIDDLALTVSLSTTPSLATVGANQSVCGLTSTALGGNTPAVGTGTWSQFSGPGTTTFSAINSGSSTATASATGTYVYRWTIANGCATINTADVTVEYKEAAPTPTITASGTTSFCEGGSVTLSSSEANGIVWSTTATTQDITVTTSGNYTVTYTAANGCSATSAAATVTVTPNTSNTTSISACDTYTWSVNNQTYTASGLYTVVNGCDTQILNLTITPSTTSTQTVTACDSYTWTANNVTYTASGSYTATVGCETITLVLTINNSSTTTTTQTACDSYTWSQSGQTYTTSGTYTSTGTNALGCPDFHTLILTINSSTIETQTVAACDSYTWSINGQTYTASGTYEAIGGPNASGCSITYRLVLTINVSLTTNETVTACDSYTWSQNNVTYTSSGVYTAVGTTGAGCADTHILTLTINNSTSSTQTVTACDSYTWSVNNQTYTASGTYIVTGLNAAGCVDTQTLVLTINNSSSSTQTETACDSYTWSENNQTYTASGTYVVTGTNAAGCPDTKTLVLTINNSTSSSQSVTACDTYTWSVNNQTYTASGTYTSTSTNAAGCPDIKTLVLTITPSTSNTTTITADGSYIWSVNNVTYTQSGTYTFVNGCDTQILVLTINPCTGGTTTETACDTYTWPVNNVTYTESGTYTFGSGCDLQTLILTINNSTSSSESQTACGSYTWPVNGQTYTASGTYTSTSTNAAGCPDTKTLVLTINSSAISTQPADTNICSVVGSTASISVATPIVGATYTWQFRVVTTTATGPWNTISISNAGTTYTGYTTATLGITRSSTLVPAKGIEYRVTINGGPCGPVTSATAKLNILGAVKAGLIANPTSVCLGNDLTFTLSGFIGTSFQWQSAPSNSVAAPGVFTDIPGATSSTYTIVGATAAINKAYRVVVTNGPCGGTTATSSVKSIKVDPLTVPGTSTGGGTVCSGGSGTLRVTGNVGKVQWEYSTDGGTTYTNAPKASAIPPGLPFATTSASSASTSYIVTNITAPLHFRARVTSGACLVEYSNVLTFVLGTQAQVGTVSAVTSTLCPGTGTTLNLSGPNVGVIAWQRSTNFATANPTWLNILNSNSTVRPTGNLTLSTAYRAVVTIGSCSTVISNVQIVTVVAKPVSKTITGNVTSPTGGSATAALCTTNASKILTIGAGSTGAIQWQTSITSTTAGFVDIPGATGQSYTVTNPQVGPNYFRATFTNSCGVVVTGTAFTVHYKSCREAAPATIGSSATLGKEFGVVAFPNPYTNNFNLSLTSSSDAMIQVSVYDMTGRMLEQREVSPSQVGEQEIGQTYPTGVYNVIVTQGEEVKTLRVIKR